MKFQYILVLIFCTAVVVTDKLHLHKIQDMVHRIKESSKSLVNLIENLKTSNNPSKHSVAVRASGLADYLQDLIQHKLSKLDKGSQAETQNEIEKYLDDLNSYAKFLCKSVDAGLTQNQIEPETNVENDTENKLNQHRFFDRDLIDSLGDLLYVVKRMTRQIEQQSKTHEEINNNVKSLVEEITTAVNKIKTYDEETANKMADAFKSYTIVLNNTSAKLQAEVNAEKCPVKEKMQAVSTDLKKIQSTLNQNCVDPNNPKKQIEEIKKQVIATVKTVSRQVCRLNQIIRPNVHIERLAANLKSIMAEILCATETLKKLLEEISKPKDKDECTPDNTSQ